jgi:hypothetical protein
VDRFLQFCELHVRPVLNEWLSDETIMEGHLEKYSISEVSMWQWRIKDNNLVQLPPEKNILSA